MECERWGGGSGHPYIFGARRRKLEEEAELALQEGLVLVLALL